MCITQTPIHIMLIKSKWKSSHLQTPYSQLVFCHPPIYPSPCPSRCILPMLEILSKYTSYSWQDMFVGHASHLHVWSFHFDFHFVSHAYTYSRLSWASFVLVCLGWCILGYHFCGMVCLTISLARSNKSHIYSIMVIYELECIGITYCLRV